MCTDGSKCKYSHTKSAKPPKGSGEGKGKAKVRPRCKYFAEGNWKAGSKSQYSHTINAASGLVEDDWELDQEEDLDFAASSGLVLPDLVCEARPEPDGIKWVIDTGTGIHLVPEVGPGGVLAAPSIKIQTANGIVTTLP